MKAPNISLVLISLILLACITASTSEVVALTSLTFRDKVDELDSIWFVKFCVPWCKYCKNLGSLWEDLGKAMEEDDEIEIAELDCSTDKATCTSEDIHSYPTFRIYYNNGETSKYQGKRDVQLLKAFALEEAAKAVKSAS